jgi:hypothetical protein
MRKNKHTHDQFRIWRSNAPATEENGLTAREAIKKELLERNDGLAFRLRSPMGPFLCTVRGENNSPGSLPMAANGAPSPDACLCKQFAGTEPGKHHAVCQHRAAWEAASPAVKLGAAAPAPNLNPGMTVTTQKVMAPIDTTPKVQHMQVAKQVSMHQAPIKTAGAPVASQALPAAPPVPVGVAVMLPAIALISPEQCDCRAFAKPSDADPKQHHFVCQHFEKWKTAHPTQTPSEHETLRDTEPPTPDEHTADYVLVDLDSRAVLRDATSEEVTTAREEEAKNGSPIITIDDGVYAVVERPIQQVAAAGE